MRLHDKFAKWISTLYGYITGRLLLTALLALHIFVLKTRRARIPAVTCGLIAFAFVFKAHTGACPIKFLIHTVCYS